MPTSIAQALAAVAERRERSPALCWRESVWTYGDLRLATEAIRSALTKRELARGARVAMLLRNSPHYVAACYGVLSAGCVAAPLNAQERALVLARQIGHCGAQLLIGEAAHPEWSALRAALRSTSIEVMEVSLHDGAGFLARFIHETGEPQGAPAVSGFAADELAMIIYTSGTTGRPKGVMLSHGNLHSNALAIIEYLSLNDTDRGLCVLPLQFSYGASVLNSHLLCGARLILEDNFAFPQTTLQRMQDEAITGFAGVPSTFALLLGRCNLQNFDLSRLRYVTQAGGAMPRPLIDRLRRQLPATQIFIMYGQTEATARLTYLPPALLDEKAGSVGLPIRNVEIDVRDPQQRSAPAGVAGEIVARGPNVMLGYWNDPVASAQAIGDGWLHTGDLGHRDNDGYLYIDGRAIEMIKVGAFRVSPQEIEEVIAALEGVEEVAVTGIPDEILGQAIKAVIVTTPGTQLQRLAIKAHCRQQLAAYKVPGIIEFAAALPRTSSGKVQRFRLA